MISERQFADSHTAFWHDLLPMAEEYVRTKNRQLIRFARPLKSLLPPQTRGVVNELGFRLVVASMDYGGLISNLPSPSVEKCVDETLRFIHRLREYGRVPVDHPTRAEIDESVSLAERLALFLQGTNTKLISFPFFPGCGWLDECTGDFVAGRTLVEVKAGDRNFRSIDLRQVLTYCALNFAGKSYEIVNMCLVNPRHGVFFQEPLEAICDELAGRPAAELLGEIVEYASEPGGRSKSV